MQVKARKADGVTRHAALRRDPNRIVQLLSK
jgi:hypothetical protein